MLQRLQLLHRRQFVPKYVQETALLVPLDGALQPACHYNVLDPLTDGDLCGRGVGVSIIGSIVSSARTVLLRLSLSLRMCHCAAYSAPRARRPRIAYDAQRSLCVVVGNVARRAVFEGLIQICTEEHIHLEAALLILPRAHPASEEMLVNAKIGTLIHDLHLHALRFLAIFVVLQILPVDRDIMLTEAEMRGGAEPALESIERGRKTRRARYERHSLLPAGVAWEASDEQDVQILCARRDLSHELRSTLCPVGHVATHLREASAI